MSLNDPFLIESKIWKMENLEKGIEVSQLIVKDLQGCISPEEKVMLDKWLEESPENREVYHRVQGRGTGRYGREGGGELGADQNEGEGR